MDPSSLKYTRTHEWVHLEGDQATIGITDFAVNQLTDLVFIQLPTPGTQVQQGDTFGEVESVKAVSDLYAPLAGEVAEVNESLADDLAALSEDPYGRGWMVKLKLADATSADQLMDRAAYEQHCQTEEH